MDRKELIEKVRELLACGALSKEAADAIKGDFLELKESEDEMHRKWILEYLYDGLRKTDEQFKGQFKSAIAWLEKQKANPKNTDSIPSDCASNAKCEDRWHKAKDSLPGDSREVICKDAIGNYFIGRYYKCSDSWEVMMYDDCDKSNDDNPHVVMWVDIPSEEQKEQKPVEKPDLVAELKHHLATTPKEQLEKEWKELEYWGNIGPTVQEFLYGKPVEWSEEDERYRNAIINALNGWYNYLRLSPLTGLAPSAPFIDEERAKQIAWLKSLRPQQKQEREPMEIKYGGKVYQVYAVRSLPGGATGYIIEDEPGHYDCIIHPDEVLGGGYGIKSNGSPYPTKEANFGQPHWKPSEEQMEALADALSLAKNCGEESSFDLRTLYEQLKKL